MRSADRIRAGAGFIHLYTNFLTITQAYQTLWNTNIMKSQYNQAPTLILMMERSGRPATNGAFLVKHPCLGRRNAAADPAADAGVMLTRSADGRPGTISLSGGGLES